MGHHKAVLWELLSGIPQAALIAELSAKMCCERRAVISRHRNTVRKMSRIDHQFQSPNIVRTASYNPFYKLFRLHYG